MKFAIMRKTDEFVAKIANSRLTKILCQFQHSLKGCQLLPPWHFLLFASLLDWRLQVDMRKNLSHPLKGNCAMCFQAVLCNGLFERMRLQGATFYLCRRRPKTFWHVVFRIREYIHRYNHFSMWRKFTLALDICKTIPKPQYLKQKNYAKKRIIRDIC